MGNLTSDVKFGADYVKGDGTTDNSQTYYSYKSSSYLTGTPSSTRNNGSSMNHVALASGVFLELTTENSTADHKDYGYITGVVELDLINVKKDNVGGGFVYAKNEHRVPMYFPNKKNVLLSAYNKPTTDGGVAYDEARTYRRYSYTSSDEPTSDAEKEGAYVISGDDSHLYNEMEWQTSGNFIHPKKHIVDDCYPTNNAYLLSDPNHSEAHYWYVKGEVYIYDQKVSAYTGAANAYSKEVHLPLTITAASHGQLRLLNVKPNLYAYYVDDGTGVRKKIGSINDAHGNPIDKVWVNNDNDSYGLNDVITWWDWHQMSGKDRMMFVTDTYVNTVACLVDGTQYAAGEYVIADTEFADFKTAGHVIKNLDGSAFLDDDNNDIGLEHVFRSSNNIGHDTGYVLTFDMDSPDIWNDYYTKVSATDKIRESAYDKQYEEADDAGKENLTKTWIEGPTFTPIASGAYGQRQIEAGDILPYETVRQNVTTGEGTAVVEVAYVAKEAVTYDYTYTDEDGVEQTITKTTNAGTAIPVSEYNTLDAETKASFAEAYVCTQTIKLGENNYLGYGELKTRAEIDQLKTNHSSIAKDIENAMTAAYVCSKAGNYGGQQFDSGTNYSALAAWCSLPYGDRIAEDGSDKFRFNYDAFDILSDDDFLKIDLNEATVTVDKTGTESTPHTSTFRSPYSDVVGVEYQAVFKGKGSVTSVELTDGTTVTAESAPLTNEEFEAKVRNEKRHYTKVTVAGGGESIYITKDNFVYNGTPYGNGMIVDADLYASNPSHVEELTFENSELSAVTKYFCFEDYGEGADKVCRGTVISETEWGKLPNDQQYFTIQGKEPTETTTLYVSSESDILDVTKERVYTVVYQYTYYEDEDDGTQKLTNELHVINIHVVLESGAPSIGQLMPPGTVLPNWGVGMKAPDVKPGLYEVLTNGWELFNSYEDALHHRNGSTFINNSTPVYWYQNQDHYVSFYSKTYLGKTYSNPVPLSVANYHDLDAVMNDKAHHFYVDRSDVDRPCKIYIDDRPCASDENKSELDLLKDFYDLSVLSGSPAEGTALAGHSLLGSHVRGGSNLEFILRSDVSPKAYTPTAPGGSATWTPIGTGDTPCFSGTLHGDGHTISGLDHSLFDKLCGEVYNLGVTGSFTGAGIAETGDGYIENCWITSTATSGFATGPDTGPVFGTPTRDASDRRGPIQIVNCYYPTSNAYTVPASAAHGQATQMPDQAFYNGTVAYNLNGFYLKKRFYDNATSTVPGGFATEYRYLPSAADGMLPTEMATAKYPNTYAVYQPVGTDDTPYLGYVESRFYDGDFIYAAGTVPETNNIRMRTVTTSKTNPDGSTTTTSKNYFTPIWPDDYLFFGQRLTYGHVDGRPHQETPSAINRSNERIDVSDVGNRVYRAPAYFRSKQMDVAHFNPAAVFAQTKKDDASIMAYKDMTAIDFTGHNDLGWALGAASAEAIASVPGGFAAGKVPFFPPLLDDDGLTSLQNVDLTRNLLVYTSVPGGSAAGKTGTVVSTYLSDGAYHETHTNYRTVDVWDSSADDIRGHWVQLSDAGYTAQRDHLLVDRQDFNAPIAYQFGRDHRMWHQRRPDNYVETALSGSAAQRSTTGWEGISLPFKAEIVTTQQKGELTHFYNSVPGGFAANIGSTGHEYWLRHFTALTAAETVPDGSAVVTATMTYPAANSADGQKDYSNTFLWDYYYQYNNYDDLNRDDYQEKDTHRTYYKQGREYPDYPRLAAATPYIIGFPGPRYYEFDLSGTFTASTALPIIPAKLDQQVITFASATGAGIGVSDDETSGDTQTYGGNDYTFKPSYMNEAFDAGTSAYTLATNGACYDKVPDTGSSVAAFRPYFTSKPSGNSRELTRSIIFSNETNEGYMPHEANSNEPGTLIAHAAKHKIVVTSTLKYTTDVRIVNAAGQTFATFSIKPGETIETRMSNAGVFIVQDEEGNYTKKLAVK